MATDPKKILGTCIVKIDGAKYKTVPDSVVLGFGGREVFAEAADDTIQYREGPLMPSTLECEFQHTANTDVRKLNEATDVLIEIETNLGLTYTMPGARRTGPPITTSSSNGRIKFQASGDPVPGL